jgi:pimeloyl-ACP methyl ester carboxylesterase
MIDAGGLSFETDVCGSGEKLALCLHGFPESKFSWRHQLPFLADLGYTVWAPNLRGYGKTSRPAERSAYTLSALMGDVVALTEVAAQEGLQPSLLVAHDWGGAIAWSSLITRAVSFERFIPMNMPHPLLFRRGVWRPRQFLRSLYILFFQLPWLPERGLLWNDAYAIRRTFYGMAIDKSCFPDAVLDHYAALAQEPGALTAMLNYYRAALPAFYSTPLNQKLDTPTLLIWGEEDRALGTELNVGAEKWVSDFTYRPVPGVSHWIQQEAPEVVNELIAEWLGQARP